MKTKKLVCEGDLNYLMERYDKQNEGKIRLHQFIYDTELD